MTIAKVKILPPKKAHQLALAEVILSDDSHNLTIRDIRILQSKNGGLWIGEPEHTRHTNGERGYVYVATVGFCPSLKREVSEAVISAYKAKAHAASEQHGPESKNLCQTNHT